MLARYQTLNTLKTAATNAETTLRSKISSIVTTRKLRQISSCSDLVLVSQNLLQAIQEEDTESTIDYTSEISELSITLSCSSGESDSLNTIADDVTEEIEELQNLIDNLFTYLLANGKITTTTTTTTSLDLDQLDLSSDLDFYEGLMKRS